MTLFENILTEGIAAQKVGHLATAERLYRTALKINKNNVIVQANLSALMAQMGRIKEATDFAREALRINPKFPNALSAMGTALSGQYMDDEATKFFRRALAFEPNNPLFLSSIGATLINTGHFDQAIINLEKSLRISPNQLTESNLGTAYWSAGRLVEAEDHLKAALRMDPKLAMAHKNLGFVLLMQERFREGWQHNEWRKVSDPMPDRGIALPLWMGEDLTNKTLFVTAEQGIGDQILHASMIRDLERRGINTVWETDARLCELIRRTHSVTVVAYSKKPKFETCDYQLPALTLGGFFRDRIRDFPTPPYLQQKTPSFTIEGGNKIVGVSWESRNKAFGKFKTAALEHWAEIFKVPGVTFVDLQYGNTASDRARFGKNLDHRDVDLFYDVDGLADLIAECDLVITVSNSTAHLAGALGVPTWVIVPNRMGKLWYWGCGEKTPWYPSCELIRSTEVDWKPVMSEVERRLRDLVCGVSHACGVA